MPPPPLSFLQQYKGSGLGLLLEHLEVEYKAPVLFIETVPFEWLNHIRAPEIVLHFSDQATAFTVLEQLEEMGLDDSIRVTTGDIRLNDVEWTKRYGLIVASLNTPKGLEENNWTRILSGAIVRFAATSCNLVFYGNYTPLVNVYKIKQNFKEFCLSCVNQTFSHIKKAKKDNNKYVAIASLADAYPVEVGATIGDVLRAHGRAPTDVLKDPDMVDIVVDNPYCPMWLTEVELRLRFQNILGESAKMRTTAQRTIVNTQVETVAAWYTINRLQSQSLKVNQYYNPDRYEEATAGEDNDADISSGVFGAAEQLHGTDASAEPGESSLRNRRDVSRSQGDGQGARRVRTRSSCQRNG